MTDFGDGVTPVMSAWRWPPDMYRGMALIYMMLTNNDTHGGHAT